MDKSKTNRGQAIVEVALLLPLLILVTAVSLQLIILCHNAVSMQMIAARLVRRVSIQQKTSLESLSLVSLLWGRVLPPRVVRSSALCPVWRPFKPVLPLSTIQTPGSFVSTKVKTTLFPGSLVGGVLAHLSLETSAETLLEPVIPREDS